MSMNHVKSSQDMLRLRLFSTKLIVSNATLQNVSIIFSFKTPRWKKNQRQIASSINISFIQTFHFPSFSSCKNVYWVHPTCEPRLQKNQNYEVIQKFIWIQFAVQFWWMRKFDRQKSVTMVIVTYISWHVVVWQRLCTAKIVSKLTNKCQSDIWCVSRVQQVSLRFTFTFTLTRKFSTVIH